MPVDRHLCSCGFCHGLSIVRSASLIMLFSRSRLLRKGEASASSGGLTGLLCIRRSSSRLICNQRNNSGCLSTGYSVAVDARICSQSSSPVASGCWGGEEDEEEVVYTRPMRLLLHLPLYLCCLREAHQAADEVVCAVRLFESLCTVFSERGGAPARAAVMPLREALNLKGRSPLPLRLPKLPFFSPALLAVRQGGAAPIKKILPSEMSFSIGPSRAL